MSVNEWTLAGCKARSALNRKNMFSLENNKYNDFCWMHLRNIHEGLASPSSCTQVLTIKGDYEYYHYGLQEVTDQGWGCGYRTLQSIASWLIINIDAHKEKHVPTVKEIQEILVASGDKNNSFIDSKEWIGSFEVFLVLDHIFDISCKLKHVNSGKQLDTLTNELVQHFTTLNPPIMMGGDTDCASKGILGIATDENFKNTHLLIMDPHFTNYGEVTTTTNIQELGFIKWVKLFEFYADSFYNLCIPLI